MVAFFVNMEWTGQQQIQFLLRSIILGVLQGLCLDLMTSLLVGRKRRRWLWTDVLFGPLAAIVTFFGALVIMDGQLHPLLFFGIALGMLVEHATVGCLIALLLRYVRRWMNEIKRITHIFFAIVRNWGEKLLKKRQNSLLW